MSSSAYIYVSGITYTFTGVLSIKHSLSLKLSTDSNSDTGLNTISGARNQPDKVVMTVVESDTAHMQGWSARMLQALKSVKYNRALCTVVTPHMTYWNMLLSDISVTHDDTNNAGWEGTLTFTEAAPEEVEEEVDDNASTTTNTGSAGTAIVITNTPLQELLQRAGISENDS